MVISNWREKLAAWPLIIIGVIYLGIWVFSTFLHERGLDTTPSSDKLVISKDELMYHFRTVITFGTCLFGGILLLRGRRLGWVLSLLMLIVFAIICSGGLYQSISIKEYGLTSVAAGGLVVLLFWIISLLLPSVRQRLQVGKNEWIRVTVLLALYSILYFL